MQAKFSSILELKDTGKKKNFKDQFYTASHDIKTENSSMQDKGQLYFSDVSL